MSKLSFDDSLNALSKPHDSKTLLQILVTIRKEVEWPKHKEQIAKLRQNGSLRHFMKMFNMNKNILDICLSILGNCIMDKGCARDAIGVYNILTPLGQLLKRYPGEDSINGRIFRIIGNMCNHKDQWANIIIDQQSEIITHGVEILKKFSKDNTIQKNDSEATILMTLRALRLLQNRRTIITLVRNFEILKVIGSLFIKLSKEWQENGKNEVLLQSIIKLLCEYSKYKFYHSILQMRNTERGDSLLHLSNVLLLAPKRIVKIVMNFIRISQLKSELPIPEICDKFIDVLLKNLKEKDFQEDCVEYVECLCFMLENPINRNNERCGKCIPLLIQIIAKFENPSKKELDLCILIIATLNKCTYDDNIIHKQLQCNIIEILVQKMQWIIGLSSKIDKSHKRNKKPRNDMVTKYLEWECRESEYTYGKRRKCNLEETYDLNSSLLSPQSFYSSDDERLDRASSPCSSIDSDYPSSPSSSPPPLWMTNVESDSDDYSPVCSEADPNEFGFVENNDKGSDDSIYVNMNSVDEVEELDEDDNCNVYTEKKDVNLDVVKIRILTEITNLIKCFTRIRPPLPQLGTEKLLWALLKSIDVYSFLPNCVNPIDVIGRILESPEHLIPLMTSNFIETMYDFTILQHTDCGTCMDFLSYGKFVLKKLQAVAESESGKGDIAHSLLRGTNELKDKLVLVIPYIIWDKTILGKLMLDCGGLDKLMQLLQQEITLKERICKVLCAMATKNLKIANPKYVALNLGERKIIHIHTYKLDASCTNFVTFKLDDGSSLEADREFLCEKSEFFNRLLSGNFKERNEDEIYLHNVELKPFECLLQLLQSIENTSDVEIKVDLETLLDVIMLCDRYLIQDLCCCLLNSVEKFRISRKTVPVIYRWSLESRTNLLRIESIAYALVADITVSQRLKMFEELFSLGYSSELLEDIHKLLARYLHISELQIYK